MNIERCGRCAACQRLETARQTVLRCANPPFSHADSGTALLWNQQLFDHPCEVWGATTRMVVEGQLLSLPESVRPTPKRHTVRLTVDMTIEGKPPGEKLNRRLVQAVDSRLVDSLLDRDQAVGEINSTITTVDPALKGTVALAACGDVQPDELSSLIRDAVADPESSLSHSSLESQIEFLCEQLGTTRVQAKLRTLIHKRETALKLPTAGGSNG